LNFFLKACSDAAGFFYCCPPLLPAIYALRFFPKKAFLPATHTRQDGAAVLYRNKEVSGSLSRGATFSTLTI